MIESGERLRFSFHAGGLATYPAGAVFGPRTLRDYEFVWIVDGDAVWTIDGVDHAAPAGTLLLARPGMRDGFRWDPHAQTRHGFFHFAIERRGAKLPPERDWPLMLPLGRDDVVRPLFRQLAWLLAVHPPGWEELAQGALRQALLSFIASCCDTPSDEGDDQHPLIEKVMRHVTEQWSKGRLISPPLTRLAAVADVSRAHLSRVFRAHLGATPMEALRLMRLERATTLLARSNLQIQEIATQTGFENPFHFTRQFTRTYGCSPRAFRRRLAEGMNLPTIRLVKVRRLSARLWQG